MNDDVVLDDAFEIRDESFIDRYSDRDDDNDEDYGESGEAISNEDASEGEANESDMTLLKERIEPSSVNDERRSKKKRKLDELKTLKAAKKQATHEEPTACLSKSDMIKIIQMNAPVEFVGAMSKLKPSSFLGYSEVSSIDAIVSSSSSYIKAMSAGLPSLKKAIKVENISDAGSPKVLIVCSNASKATDIIKEISLHLKCKIAKLYARHFKVCHNIQ